MFYKGVTFQMALKGWALSTDNRLRIADGTKSCGSSGTSKDDSVSGPLPSTPLQLAGVAGSLQLLRAHAKGTEVIFKDPHHLVVDAHMIISDVTGGTSVQAGMFNTEHTVLEVIDDKAIAIGVHFATGQFPP
jgi:hypothetical protein